LSYKGDRKERILFSDKKPLVFEGLSFPVVNIVDIPPAVVAVPIKVQDLAKRIEHCTTMVAGFIGMTAALVGKDKDENSVHPRSGWWVPGNPVKPI